MKKAVAEKNIVLVLFVVVLLVFSLAERDTKKIFRQYSKDQTVIKPPHFTAMAKGRTAPAPSEN